MLVKESVGETPKRHDLKRGDLAVIPAWTEYQMCNESPSGGDDVVCLVVQSGSRLVGTNLVDWGGDEISTRG